MQIEIATKQDLVALQQEIIKAVKELLDSNNKPVEQLRSKEVMKILGYTSASSLKSLRDRKKLKFSRIGKTFFYDAQSVNQLLNKN